MTNTRFDRASDADGAPRFDMGVISRAGLLERAALLGGGAVAITGVATALAQDASSAASAAGDVRILTYVLRLEELKAAFYGQATEGGALTGELNQLADVLARHERAHVSFLRRHLGRRAEDERTYDFGDSISDADAFASTTRTLEETAVAAYIGQGANLTRRLMVEFAQLCSVEGRHAAWIADLLGRSPAPRAADDAKTPREIVALIEETGFETTT
jgi:Ferritin-like domain